MDNEERALLTAKRWKNKTGTCWADGSGLDDGSVGAAVAFLGGRHAAEPGTRWSREMEGGSSF